MLIKQNRINTALISRAIIRSIVVSSKQKHKPDLDYYYLLVYL